jgi:hypothetical protein
MFSHNESSDFFDDENEGLLLSLVLAVTNAFSCCSKSQKQKDQATYVDVKPSQTITAPREKGMFARSFDQIPCDRPIYDYQYKTGRRYVSGDNFPRSPDLDIYLAREKSLSRFDSTGSLTLATEANLDFHILADEFVGLFAKVSEAQVESLRSQFPEEVSYFLEHGERLTCLVVKQEFTHDDGAENLEALQEIVEILRGMNMKMFFRVLSQSSLTLSRCSSASTLSEEQSDFTRLTPACVPITLKPQQMFDDYSYASDSGESLEVPVLPSEEAKSDLTLDIDSSLEGFSPIAGAKIEFKRQSAVDMFEEWVALQTPCFSPL